MCISIIIGPSFTPVCDAVITMELKLRALSSFQGPTRQTPLLQPLARTSPNIINNNTIIVPVHRLQQATPEPAAAAQLLGLFSPRDLSKLPRAGHTLREATGPLLHQDYSPAFPAVAITVGGARALPWHPPRDRPLGARLPPAPRLTARAPTRRQDHGSQERSNRGARQDTRARPG